MNKLFKNNKGVSLPLVIGLVALLMIASVTANEMIIRALRSASQIEASDRAYFAAEAGVEDALYELTAHFAGYETPELGSANVRSTDFNLAGSIGWDNEWEIESISDGNTFDGVVNEKQKLVISLFNDGNGTSKTTQNSTTGVHGIYETSTINQIDASSSFSIEFRVPHDAETAYSSAFFSNITIDNDEDGFINEDGPENTKSNCVPNVNPTIESNDGDCDGREDEDSEQDPIIYWKIIDDDGNNLTPIRGCSTDDPTDNNDTIGSEICEVDFTLNGSYISFTLTNLTTGINEDGNPITVGDFINTTYPGRSADSKVQFEFLVVAPLKHSYDDGGFIKTVVLPHLEYTVSTPGNNNIPYPYYTIRSDGYYRDFKQSITTTITPKTTVPLFDFTIIQQQ